MVDYGILWHIMVCYGILWYVMVYYGILCSPALDAEFLACRPTQKEPLTLGQDFGLVRRAIGGLGLKPTNLRPKGLGFRA